MYIAFKIRFKYSWQVLLKAVLQRGLHQKDNYEFDALTCRARCSGQVSASDGPAAKGSGWQVENTCHQTGYGKCLQFSI